MAKTQNPQTEDLVKTLNGINQILKNLTSPAEKKQACEKIITSVREHVLNKHGKDNYIHSLFALAFDTMGPLMEDSMDDALIEAFLDEMYNAIEDSQSLAQFFQRIVPVLQNAHKNPLCNDRNLDTVLAVMASEAKKAGEKYKQDSTLHPRDVINQQKLAWIYAFLLPYRDEAKEHPFASQPGQYQPKDGGSIPFEVKADKIALVMHTLSMMLNPGLTWEQMKKTPVLSL